MLNIGDFARLGGISVRMLRHYDAIGLLVPASVDPRSGYRRYDVAQLARLNRILALKDLGFTLDAVRSIVDEEVGSAELRGMLRLRQTELTAQVEADRERLARVERRLRTIEMEGHMSELEFQRKSLPAVRLAELHETVASVDEVGAVVGPLFDRLFTTMGRLGVTPGEPGVAAYDGSDEGIVAIAGVPYDGPPVDGLEVRELSAEADAVTVMHLGSMETIGDAWQALVRHVEDAGLELSGPCREVYHATPMDDPDSWVTELQQPVR
ncbi:MAG TPA: MerR family transcriptional regulator [Nocardioides sp.]|uniref:MerR family transcriptional regulator n=1 Tax=Nocardioides sp. TaxID=35761 RepID=UPI002D802365|nr:MerR family transcriptional regulator [Nocardioides sp.]HET6651642.1 MerR family transcriptional regulator [Nocardioides sp.]